MHVSVWQNLHKRKYLQIMGNIFCEVYIQGFEKKDQNQNSTFIRFGTLCDKLMFHEPISCQYYAREVSNHFSICFAFLALYEMHFRQNLSMIQVDNLKRGLIWCFSLWVYQYTFTNNKEKFTGILHTKLSKNITHNSQKCLW